MRQAVEIQLRALPLAVSRAAWQMGLEYVKPQVKRVSVASPPAEPDPAPLQLIARKACRVCGESKPLSDFHQGGDRVRTCRLCTKVKRSATPVKALPLEAHASMKSQAVAGLVTLESLTTRAIKSKARCAVYEVGRVKIEAKYSKADSEVTYFIGGWPCYPDDVTELLHRVHSGVGTGGMQL